MMLYYYSIPVSIAEDMHCTHYRILFFNLGSVVAFEAGSNFAISSRRIAAVSSRYHQPSTGLRDIDSSLLSSGFRL